MLPLRLLATAAVTSIAATASAVDVTVSNDQFLGDSVWDFSTVQGTNGWNYGYYNFTGDVTAGYDPVADFQLMPTSGSGYAVGGNPPWTNVFALTGHPNGTNNGAEHWAIRRYTIQPGEAGNLALSWFMRDTGPGGDGVIGAVLLNGTEVASQALTAGDTTGFRLSLNLTVAAGDKLDLALNSCRSTKPAVQTSSRMPPVPVPSALHPLGRDASKTNLAAVMHFPPQTG